MIHFKDDYSTGAHPNVLEALAKSNDGLMPAYGQDPVSEDARSLIMSELGRDCDIHFVASGTMANLLMIASALRPHEAVISVDGGHIATHEAGSIEATGHKIISVPAENGKLTADVLLRTIEDNTMPPHMAKPRLVYISNATETGTVYTKSEVTQISRICRDKGLYLMMDGARLAAALAANSNDLTLADMAALTDMFWIGGTKAGALMGEAVVLSHPDLKPDFGFHVKQRGALLAKGRAIGAQFKALFTNGLYVANGRHANQAAEALSRGILDKGFELAEPTESNQVFPILPNAVIEKLELTSGFYVWGPAGDDHSIIRLVTSWATTQDEIDGFLGAL